MGTFGKVQQELRDGAGNLVPVALLRLPHDAPVDRVRLLRKEGLDSAPFISAPFDQAAGLRAERERVAAGAGAVAASQRRGRAQPQQVGSPSSFLSLSKAPAISSPKTTT